MKHLVQGCAARVVVLEADPKQSNSRACVFNHYTSVQADAESISTAAFSLGTWCFAEDTGLDIFCLLQGWTG